MKQHSRRNDEKSKAIELFFKVAIGVEDGLYFI